MDQVYLYEDDQYYIVELESGEGINIDENCVQYIAVDGLKNDEDNNIDVNNYDTVEEVICETETESQEPITVSAVYGGVENFDDLITGKENNTAVIVEKIPINIENTTKVIREEEIITDENQLESNQDDSEINLNQSDLSLNEDNVSKNNENLSDIGGNENIISGIIENEVTLAMDKKAKLKFVEKDNDALDDEQFEAVFVPEVKPFKISKKAKKRVPHSRKVSKTVVEAHKKDAECMKALPEEVPITEELPLIINVRTTKSPLQKKKTAKQTQVKQPTKRKRESLKEIQSKKLKIEQEKYKIENQPPKFKNKSPSQQKESTKVVDLPQATRKSSRKSIKKEYEDFEMEDDLVKKKDYRALTRVVFSPRKDKSTNQNQKTVRKGPGKRKGDSLNQSNEDKMEMLDEDGDTIVPRANLRVAASIPKKSDKRYRCQYCCNSYDIASSYYNHVRNTHGKDSTPATCELCPGVFKNRDSLLRHLRLYHTGPDAGKTHICHICGAKYNLKGGLVSHLKHFHDKDDDALDDALNKCIKIEEASERRPPKGPTKHVIKNKSKNNKRRKQNNKVSENNSKQVNILPERKEKRFECNLCGSRFTQKSSMYRHVRMNHKEKSTITKKETNKKGKVNRKVIKKVVSEKETTVKTNVKDTSIKNVSNDDKKPKCKICFRVYSSRQSLSNHFSIKHKQVKVKVNRKGNKNVDGGKPSKFLAMFK